MLQEIDVRRFQGVIASQALRAVETNVPKVSLSSRQTSEVKFRVFSGKSWNVTGQSVHRVLRLKANQRPLVAVDPSTRFKFLAAKWKSDTRFMSSTEDIVMSDAYQRIMAMGPAAIPLIFAEMKAEGANPHYWHWALERLTGADPTSNDIQGDSEALRDAWLGWASENGFTE